MRSLATSSLILLITLGFIILNAFTVNKKLSYIYTTVSSLQSELDDDNIELLGKLVADWSDIEPFLSLTSHRTMLDEAEHHIVELAIAFYKTDEYEFAASKTALIDVLGEIASSQSLEFKSIF